MTELKKKEGKGIKDSEKRQTENGIMQRNRKEWLTEKEVVKRGRT